MAEDASNPLLPLHQQVEAEFQPYAEAQIVSTFGEPQAEYAAIRKSAALIDEPQRGVLELSGQDRLAFLNNLLTNQIWSKESKSGLAQGQGRYAFFLNKQGRIVADLNVLELEDRALLEMDARLVKGIRSAFEKYLFTEQVKLADRVGTLHQFAMHGPGACALLSGASGTPLAELKPIDSVQTSLFDARVILWRDDMTGNPGFHLLMDVKDARRLWMRLLEAFAGEISTGKRRLRAAGWAALNATRIEAGRPLFGIDFDENMLPAETGLLQRAVSFTKGCYLGQEIVARMHARGQAARQIVGIQMSDDALPIAGAQILDEQSQVIGGVTSSTISPVLSNAAIALALVKRPFYSTGSVVYVPAEGRIRQAAVVDLPFLKG